MTISGLIGVFAIKKLEFYLRALFLEVFLSHLVPGHFSYQISANGRHDLQSIEKKLFS